MAKVKWQYKERSRKATPRSVEAVPRWYDFVPAVRNYRQKRAYEQYVAMSYAVPEKKVVLKNALDKPISKVVLEPKVVIKVPSPTKKVGVMLPPRKRPVPDDGPAEALFR